MGYSRYNAAARGCAAWNAGKTVGTKRPLTQKQIWAIRFFLDREGRFEIARFSISRSTASFAVVSGQDKDRRPGNWTGESNAGNGRSTEDRASGSNSN